MSLANYLSNVGGMDKTFTVQTIYINREPEGIDDGARIADCLEYLGNATYPINPPTTQIIPTSTTFLPVFQRPTDLSGDYLRVRPAVDLFNFQQLLNFEYSLNVINSSKTVFDTRFAIYDLDLNVLQTYAPVRYDPSNNPFQPAALDSFTFKGYSVVIPPQAEYGFLEISGAGNLNVAFDYANSQLVNAIDNSDPAGGNPPGSRSSKDIFVVDWFAKPFDISGGISGDIVQLEADVAQLQIETGLLQIDVANLQSSKVNIDGTSQMTGALQVDGSLYPSGWSQGILLGNGSRASLIEGTDADPSYNPAIGIYSNQTNNERSVYLWTGDKAGNQKLNPQSVWEDATAVIDDAFAVNVPLQANAGLTISNGVINQETVAGFNVFRAPIIADFGIDMNGNGIGSLATPTIPSMATNKQYVDTADALRLPLAGGTMTGAINMANQPINNVPNPTTAQQPATKIYVDTALNGKLNTTGGSLTGALNMTTQQINNLGSPLASTDAATKGYVDGVIVSGAFLPKTGGTMTGAINMSNQQINNLGAPVANTDAATKAYVDSQTQNELPLGGGTMTGAINMNGNRILNIPTNPVSLSDAVNGTYVGSVVASALPLSGGTMTGQINMNGQHITNVPTPLVSSDAVNKAYVDAIDPTGGFLPLAGGTMTGQIDMGNNAIVNVPSSNNPTSTEAAQYSQMLSYMTGNYPPTLLPPASGYLPRDGSRPMTATLFMGGNTITQVGNLIGTGSTFTTLNVGSILNMASNRITAVGNPVGTSDAFSLGFANNNFLVLNKSFSSNPLQIIATPVQTNAQLEISGSDLVITDGDAFITGNMYGGSPRASFAVIPNGIDIEINSINQGRMFYYRFSSGIATDNSRIYLSADTLPDGTTIYIRNRSGQFSPELLIRGYANGDITTFDQLAILGGSGLGNNWGIFTLLKGSGANPYEDWTVFAVGGSGS